MIYIIPSEFSIYLIIKYKNFLKTLFIYQIYTLLPVKFIIKIPIPELDVDLAFELMKY